MGKITLIELYRQCSGRIIRHVSPNVLLPSPALPHIKPGSGWFQKACGALTSALELCVPPTILTISLHAVAAVSTSGEPLVMSLSGVSSSLESPEVHMDASGGTTCLVQNCCFTC